MPTQTAKFSTDERGNITAIEIRGSKAILQYNSKNRITSIDFSGKISVLLMALINRQEILQIATENPIPRFQILDCTPITINADGTWPVTTNPKSSKCPTGYMRILKRAWCYQTGGAGSCKTDGLKLTVGQVAIMISGNIAQIPPGNVAAALFDVDDVPMYPENILSIDVNTVAGGNVELQLVMLYEEIPI